MPSFGLFRKQEKQEYKTVSAVAVENVQEPKIEQIKKEEKTLAVQEVSVGVSGSNEEEEKTPLSELAVDDDNVPDQTTGVVVSKTYLKAMPLRDTLDLEGIKAEVEEGNILILRITPLASKSIDAVKSAVNELYMFTEAIGGDIARLGEERVVICPKNIRIWREKTQVTKNSEIPAS